MIVLGLLVGRAASIQMLRADETLVASALVPQADGVQRYQYNPRLLAVGRQLPKGDILDRNGCNTCPKFEGILGDVGRCSLMPRRGVPDGVLGDPPRVLSWILGTKRTKSEDQRPDSHASLPAGPPEDPGCDGSRTVAITSTS
jgi:hypothetical protein